MPLIRDLIHIPEQIHRDDFVLRLAEGVTNPAQTLRTCVVTPQLVGTFGRSDSQGGGTIQMNTAPLRRGAPESVGIEVDPTNQRLKRLPAVRLKVLRSRDCVQTAAAS